MEPANPLSKYCQTNKERKLIEYYIRQSASTLLPYLIPFFWMYVLVSLWIAYFMGVNHRLFPLMIIFAVVGIHTAIQFQRERNIGTVLKRISESK